MELEKRARMKEEELATEEGERARMRAAEEEQCAHDAFWGFVNEEKRLELIRLRFLEERRRNQEYRSLQMAKLGLVASSPYKAKEKKKKKIVGGGEPTTPSTRPSLSPSTSSSSSLSPSASSSSSLSSLIKKDSSKGVRPLPMTKKSPLVPELELQPVGPPSKTTAEGYYGKSDSFRFFNE